MCLERPCVGAACVGNENRGLHLHEVPAVQEIPDLLYNLGALDKGILYLRIHDQIHISLAVAHVCVGQAVELLRKDLKALGEQLNTLCMDGNFACLCLEHHSADADNIADVQLLEIFVGLLADLVPCNVRLDISLQILEVAEGRLSHNALGHHSSCQGYLFALHLLVVFLYLHAVRCHIVLRDLERIPSAFAKLGKFLTAHL